MLLVPLGERGGHVHLLDDVAPADAGVVGAEGDLAFLRGVGNDALLGAAEIVVEQILEPHAGDEQEVPAVAAALLDVVAACGPCPPCRSSCRWRRRFCRTSSTDRSAGSAWATGTDRSCAPPRAPCPTIDSHLPRAASLTRATSLRQAVGVPETRSPARPPWFPCPPSRPCPRRSSDGSRSSTGPNRLRAVHQVAPIGERGHEGNREPVARRLAQAGLVLHVVRQVRERVALRGAALVGHGFVAAGEGNRLEGQERNLLGIIQRELDDAAHLLVVDAVDDGDDRDDVHAVGVQVLDGPQFHVEQVAHLAVLVGGVADAVELQVGVAQTGLGGLPAELRALGELDAVGGRLHGGVAHLAGVADGVQEVRREVGSPPENCTDIWRFGLMVMALSSIVLDIVPGQFVHEAHLVGVHEARVAHHVAAVGQVDGQHRAAPMRDGAGAVFVQRGVVVRADVAARERPPPGA